MKRHILVPKLGLLLHAVVHPADIRDRDGGVLGLSSLIAMHPFLLKLFADAIFEGPKFQHKVAQILLQIPIEIAERSDQVKGFAVVAWEAIDWLAGATFKSLAQADQSVAIAMILGRVALQHATLTQGSPR